MKTRTQLLEEALDAANRYILHVEGQIWMEDPNPTTETLSLHEVYQERIAALDAAKDEPSEKEADELVKIAFLEWSNSPSANSAIANLRNKLCTVIGEREDLKRELARIKEQPDTITLPREIVEAALSKLCLSDHASTESGVSVIHKLTTALSQQPTKAV